ncbi:MAG: YidC/Oxa1 family membrane protein insertase [Candidatus Sericytochromatia bacterium]
MINFLIDNLMMPLLTYFHDLTGSYGWAIIFLTVVIKTMLLPLTIKSLKAQIEMQKIQPKLKELQTKYKDKPELMNQKVIELYKNSRVNPFSGCLPVLVQLPFFIAIYSTFTGQTFKDLAGKEGGFLFIQDLTKQGLTPDNIFLVMVFGISTYLMQKMMTTNPDDPMQKQMLFMMPIMITMMFIFVPVPSGALLYIVCSNLYSVLQNVFFLQYKKNLQLADGNITVEATAKEIITSKSSKESTSSAIVLDKNNTVDDDNLSPVMSSSSKSKRAKKSQKKNRKK